MRAVFTADGHLGPFEQAGAFVSPHVGPAAYASGRFYTPGGGFYYGTETKSVLRAPRKGDGTVGAFDQTTPLPEPRAGLLQTPAGASALYVSGGRLDDKPRAEVFIGHLGPASP
jgi:hypothetical protein